MKKFVLILFFLLGMSVLTLPVMAQTTQSTDQKSALLHQAGIEISTDGRLDFSEYKLIERDNTGQHINDLEPPAISFGTIIFVSISPEGIIMIMTSDGKVYEFYKPAPAVEEAEEVVIDNEPGSIRSISSTPIYSYRYSYPNNGAELTEEELIIEQASIQEAYEKALLKGDDEAIENYSERLEEIGQEMQERDIKTEEALQLDRESAQRAYENAMLHGDTEAANRYAEQVKKAEESISERGNLLGSSESNITTISSPSLTTDERRLQESQEELRRLEAMEAPPSDIAAAQNEVRQIQDKIDLEEEKVKAEETLTAMREAGLPLTEIGKQEQRLRDINEQLRPLESSSTNTKTIAPSTRYTNLVDERSEVQAEVDRLKTLVKSGNATEAERAQLKAAKETLTDIDHEIKTSPELTEQRLQYLQNDPAYINADDATKKRLEAAIESRDTATANREMDVLEKKQEHKQATAIREEVETELSSARDGLKGEIYDKDQAIEKETTKLEALKKEKEAGLTGEALTKKEQEIKEKEEQIKSLQAEKEKLTDKREAETGSSGKLTNDEKTQIESAEKALNQAKEDEAAAAQAVQSAENKSALWRNIDGTKNIKVTEMFSVGNEGKIKIVTEDPDDETNIFSRAIKLMIQTIGAFAVLMLIVGGFYMVTAQGDETRLTTGKNIFTYTALGLIVAFLSYAIVQFVISILFS